MSKRQPVIHDGQGDAMPCDCPACRSPFVVSLQFKAPVTSSEKPRRDSRDLMREARAC